jgi:hypothetical protein
MIPMRTASMKKAIPRILSILQSKRFFYVIVGLLAIQAAWIALTARYPMAFDENFHFGLIKIYAHQWGPFFTHTPPNSAAYGDLVRNPSYLYHYLMSFPYRLVALFTSQETIQIIILRFLNIGMFVGGLFMFRTLLTRMRFSPGIANLSLLMVVLIPVVPFLAGQINYDNLLFLLVPTVTLIALNCSNALTASSKLPAISITTLLVACMLSSLVKYAFLPIFVGIFLYFSVMIAINKKRHVIFKRTWLSFVSLSTSLKIVLVIALLISGGLFIERYGLNIVKYGNIQPDCAKIESVDQCLQYGPWARNHIIAANNAAAAGEVPLDPNQLLFLPAWVGGMMHRLYFAINYDFVNYYELPLPIMTAYVIGITGFVLCCVFYRTLFRNNRQLFLLISVAAMYVAGLLYVNYSDYLHFRTMLAINGRYLILILPFFFALIAAAYDILFHKIGPIRRVIPYKLGLTAVVLLLTLQGGGVLTYAVRSDADWYWPDSMATSLGLGLKNVATPFIIGAQTRVRG